MTRARTQRTVAELRAASLHMLYERAMLSRITEEIVSLGDIGPDRDTSLDMRRMTAFESYVIHVRALLHCFYPEGRIDDDDVLAADYFNDPGEWAQLCPPIAGELVGVRREINTHVAHLSYRRLKGGTEWNFTAITSALENIASTFGRSAPRDRLDGRWP